MAIDMRPEVHFDRTLLADPAKADEAVRTLSASVGLFYLLVCARGLDDELTQKAWHRLHEAAGELWTEGPA